MVSSWSFHVPVEDDSVEPNVVVAPVVAVITGGAVFAGAFVMMVDCHAFDAVVVLPAASWYEPFGTATDRVPAVGLVAETVNRYCVGDTCVTDADRPPGRAAAQLHVGCGERGAVGRCVGERRGKRE